MRQCSCGRMVACAGSWRGSDGGCYELRASMWQSGMPCHAQAGLYHGPKWRWLQRPSGGMDLNLSWRGSSGHPDSSCTTTLTAGGQRGAMLKELENAFLDAEILHPLRMLDKGSNVRPKWVQRNARCNHRSSDGVRWELRARSLTRETSLWSSATRRSPSTNLNLGKQGHQVRMPARRQQAGV